MLIYNFFREGLINDERRTGVENIKINWPALISSLIAYLIAFLLTYYIFIHELRPYTEAERATVYLEPLPEMSIYSALKIIAVLALIYYLYIITIINKLQTTKKDTNNSEPISYALIIGSLLAAISIISLFLIPLTLFSIACYGYSGYYFGKKNSKLSWKWAIWITIPWLIITIIFGGGDLFVGGGDAFIYKGLIKIVGQIYLFVACIGAFFGAAKSKKEANTIENGITIKCTNDANKNSVRLCDNCDLPFCAECLRKNLLGFYYCHNCYPALFKEAPTST